MLDTTRIAPHLHQGSFPPPGSAVRDAGFHVLVLCAAELQPPAGAYPGVAVGRVPLIDRDFTPEEWKRACQVADEVAAAVSNGKRVLITCAAGRNRSGLVTALALHRLTAMSSPDIVKLIQSARPWALSNKFFVAALERVRPERATPAGRAA